MNTATPKSKRTAINPMAAEPLMEKAIGKKISGKSAPAIPSEVTEANKTIYTVENKATTATLNKKHKNLKAKVIRDSFSFPEQDYMKISELKKTCLASGIHVKKNEILRAGLHLLTKLNLTELKQAIEQVEKIKTGRPKSSKI
ncbi:MAG: hypothetical protein ACXWTK_03635 [Methylobacter sp.]